MISIFMLLRHLRLGRRLSNGSAILGRDDEVDIRRLIRVGFWNAAISRNTSIIDADLERDAHVFGSRSKRPC